MKVLVIGNGGREHAICWKLSQSKKITKLYAAPGNAGTAQVAECVSIPAKDIEALLKFCKQNAVDLTVVGPEAPLVEGIVDLFQKNGLRIFGPDKFCAQLEGSKVFSKELMKRIGVPTADFEVFADAEKAMDYVAKKGTPIVIKADGLAGGKGVVVAQSMPKAMEAIHQQMVKKVFGSAGDRVVIEQCLIGEEASIIAVTDGKTVHLMASSQDHKRLNDGDHGPNTGGMGAYSPAPIVTGQLETEVIERVFKPVITEMARLGYPFKGFLYAGIMVTDSGIQVLEFNTRLGDPETQVILPRLKNDLLDVINAVIDNRLHEVNLEWTDETSVCVVMAAGGYPESPVLGHKISGLSSALEEQRVQVFHAGTKMVDGNFVTAGGRVLNVVGSGRGIFEALSKTYNAVEKIFFDQMQYRKDIAYRAVKVVKK